MHELSLIENMLDQLKGLKKRHGLKSISDVYVSVGEMAGVDARFLQSSYDLYVPTTPWSQLKMHITVEPWAIRCLECGLEQTVVELNNQCTQCGSQQTETVRGTEFLIQRIEGESHV